MLKRWQDEIFFYHRLIDLSLGVVAFFIAYYLRFETSPSFDGGISRHSWLLGVTLVVHVTLYPHAGFYGSLRLKNVEDILFMVVRAAVVEFFVVGSFVFLIQAKETSRYFFGLYLSINYLLVLFGKLGTRILLSSLRQRGYNFRHILLVGTGRCAEQLLAVIQKNRHWGYYVFGAIASGPAQESQNQVLGVPVLGDLKDFERVLSTKTVDEVIIALDHWSYEQLRDEVTLCESMGIPLRVTWGNLGLTRSRTAYSEFDGLPLVTFYNTALMSPLQAFLKRAIDIVISLLGFLLTLVLYPWIAHRIRKESPGPVIFRQMRVGQNGRRFKCYKFRTMYLDAEARQEMLMMENQMVGPMFKINNDPRVFPFGAFLRRTSLDELPQFINILRGDMSLVGTRPPTPNEVETYMPHYRRRLSIRPGLTGLWQVSGRSNVSQFEDVLSLDLSYIDNWSIFLDLGIIFRTVLVVFRGRGAR